MSVEAEMATTTKTSKGPSAASAASDERRSHDRFDVEWAVDCVGDDTFLYASIANISAMGIFVKTTDPANPNPGMGVRFVNLQPEQRERLVEVVRTIAYVRDPS